eukprot:2395662-Pleurochrysis_carterae.AAC.1
MFGKQRVRTLLSEDRPDLSIFATTSHRTTLCPSERTPQLLTSARSSPNFGFDAASASTLSSTHLIRCMSSLSARHSASLSGARALDGCTTARSSVTPGCVGAVAAAVAAAVAVGVAVGVAVVVASVRGVTPTLSSCARSSSSPLIESSVSVRFSACARLTTLRKRHYV